MAYRQKEYNYNDKLTKDQNLLMDKLYKMRMSGMAEAFENQLMNPNSGLESFETRFSEIINHEWSGRENKKFNRLEQSFDYRWCRSWQNAYCMCTLRHSTTSNENC